MRLFNKIPYTFVSPHDYIMPQKQKQQQNQQKTPHALESWNFSNELPPSFFLMVFINLKRQNKLFLNEEYSCLIPWAFFLLSASILHFSDNHWKTGKFY